jgi:hypothetical protein
MLAARFLLAVGRAAVFGAVLPPLLDRLRKNL